MPFLPQNVLLLHWEKIQKVLVGIIALSALKSLSQYFLITEGRYVAMQNEVLKKWTSVQEEEKKRE
jgi:hypothetical protein